MPRISYKGSTPGKDVNRTLVWLQHRHLLGSYIFESSPQAFLASRYASDIDTLLPMGVSPHNIWAIEKEESQYRHLFARQDGEGISLFTERAEDVARSHRLQSVYLDFCGNLQGTCGSTAEVVPHLPSHSALSVTLFLGREHKKPESREESLLKVIRENTKHQVTLVQSVVYRSTDEKTDHGSPMGTWTFYLGASPSRSKMRFDLTKKANGELKELLNSPGAVEALWESQRIVARNRSQAAVKANVTRRAA